MAFKVEHITISDASKELNVPPPTLRLWTKQLEEYEVHYVKRNNRDERIYDSEDIKIFAYLRDLKSEHGRKTTTKDLAYMISDRGESGEFQLRGHEDAPSPKPTHTAMELLNQDDIKKLMESDRVKQFISVVISEHTKTIRDELREDIREEMTGVIRDELVVEIHSQLEEQNKKQEERNDKILRQVQQHLEDMDRIHKADKKGFFAKLFGK